MKSDLIEIDAVLVHETEKAILVDVGDNDPVWIPKSLCEFEDGKLTLSERLAVEKGLI